MKRRSFLVLAALACAAAAYGNTRQLQQDEFDTGLLRVEEALYLGRTVPDVAVLTEQGAHKLSALIAAEPAILLFAYYGCGHACPLTIRNLAAALSGVGSSAYRVVVLSFDANDTVETMRRASAALGAEPAGWTFGLLSEEDISRLTRSVGFRFLYSERDRIFVHPSVLVFLSPAGEVMRYLYGSEPRARDLELSLIASRNRAPRLNEFVDMIKLTCFQFDAERSRYVLHPAVVLGGLGLGLLGVTGLIAFTYKPKGGA